MSSSRLLAFLRSPLPARLAVLPKNKLHALVLLHLLSTGAGRLSFILSKQSPLSIMMGKTGEHQSFPSLFLALIRGGVLS